MRKPLPASTLRLTATGVLAATALLAPSAGAQSSDALINKLVEKGILTAAEAGALREETKAAADAAAPKTNLPSWAQTLKFSGDFRGRYEGFYRDEPDFTDRSRFRYRLRFGVTANLTDSIEVGMRLGSGDATAVGGLIDPISTNQSLDNNGAKKGIYLDLAYIKWSGLDAGDFTGALTFGKMENPFVFSDLVFDGDYTPEGLAATLAWAPGDIHALRLTAGGFALKELGNTSRDAFLTGAQARWDAQWNDAWRTTAGVAALGIANPQALNNAAAANVNVGNTRVGANGELASHFNPVVADAAVTWTLESFPGFAGKFPIRLAAEYLVNPAAPSDRDTGWSAGLTFGKAGKKGAWEIGYRYKVLEADAWYEEVVDSDFGGFYGVGLAGSGLGGGYRAGTNHRGHVLKASYSPHDVVTLGVSWFLVEAIDASPAPGGTTDSVIHRLMLDASVKF